MSLSGKRIVVTGGAGFIGTTLARSLIEENEIVAVDNLHRDSLSGTALADHPNFDFVHGDVLDGELLRDVVQGATHLVHAAAIAGVDTVIESPVRTMRVNLIGTYNTLEAALAAKDTLERAIELIAANDPAHRTLTELTAQLQNSTLSSAIRPYTVGGNDQAKNI